MGIELATLAPTMASCLVLSSQSVSNLNFDLYSKTCINDPTCSCGSVNEDARHYFLKCPNYDIIRQILATNFSSQLKLAATLPSILFGNKTLTETDNMKLFKFVYKFIQESKLF